MNNKNLKIISGGQTGADLGGLVAAKLLKVSTGGWAPKGFRTLLGPKPTLGSMFNLQETMESCYKLRTIKNVQDAHITIIAAHDLASAGTALTIRKIRSLDLPYTVFKFNPAESIETALANHENSLQELTNLIIKKSLVHEQVVINVAGNSTRSSVRAFDFTCAYTLKLLTKLLNLPVKEVSQQELDRYRDNYDATF